MILFAQLTSKFTELVASWFLCYILFGKRVVLANNIIDQISNQINAFKNQTNTGLNFTVLSIF